MRLPRRLPRRLPLTAAVMLLLAVPAQADWKRHTDDGFSLALPDHLFDAPAARDGSGTVFTDATGDVRLFAFSWPREGESLRGLARNLRAAMGNERKVIYERVGRGFVVQSGYMDDGEIFYERTEPSRDGRRFVTMRLVYPESRRGDVDRHIGRIGASLKPTR